MAFIDPDRLRLTNTPEALLNQSPCIACADESDLWKLLLYVLAYANGDDIPGLRFVIDSSKCWNCQSVSESQLLQAVVVALADKILGEDFDANAMLQELTCLCVSKRQIKGAIVYELIKFINNDFENAIR